ncbi:hypothetical protein [Schleiferilactobacillus shenzhenensis]|uniref:DUF624 domain-containing protein n=1 Tax=Schleiferilactobacillus shenzhenensis LY-73 TaxID=1231336 RepID=U4TM50_9LACO|nr:hypothetical protein [Schleiferilactobacillus shenzhenensis]ERL65284.1 hypothetical protein L248_2959 [Schleiferilactobacillus shenzhenensis LY-73]
MKQQEFMYKLYHYSSYLNYILWLFEVNALMLVMNAPLFIAAIGLPLSMSSLALYIVCSLPVGPVLYAGVSALVRVKENNGVVKAFFRELKRTWFSIFKWTAVPIAAIWLILFNLSVTSRVGSMQPLWWLNVILLAVVAAFMINVMIVLATWHQPVKAAMLLTLKLSIVKSFRYYMNLIIIAGTFILLKLFPVYIILFGPALALLLCKVNFQPVIDYVNERPENK